MGYATVAACTNCGKEHPLENNYVYTCGKCGGILDVRYDYPAIRRALRGRLGSPGASGVWRFRAFLPVGDTGSIITLGEGGTPLRRAANLSGCLGVRNLLLKDETRNPTGSFKDRPTTVALSRARQLGIRTVIVASSGNAGASLSAYAAAASMKAVIIVPARTPANKLAQISAYGPVVVRLEGAYSVSYSLALEAARRFGWVNLTSTYLSPYTTEGDKTVAYELALQLRRRVPDWIVVPIGAGALLTGILKGYEELNEVGLVNGIPRMVGVQAEGCAPIAEAFRKGSKEVASWGETSTIASGISDALQGYAQDGTATLNSIRRSRGIAVAVSDAEILEASAMLSSKEGMFAEPTGAASVAGLRKLVRDGQIEEGSTVICIITGHGLKDPATTPGATQPFLLSDPDLSRLASLVGDR